MCSAKVNILHEERKFWPVGDANRKVSGWPKTPGFNLSRAWIYIVCHGDLTNNIFFWVRQMDRLNYHFVPPLKVTFSENHPLPLVWYCLLSYCVNLHQKYSRHYWIVKPIGVVIIQLLRLSQECFLTSLESFWQRKKSIIVIYLYIYIWTHGMQCCICSAVGLTAAVPTHKG